MQFAELFVYCVGLLGVIEKTIEWMVFLYFCLTKFCFVSLFISPLITAGKFIDFNFSKTWSTKLTKWFLLALGLFYITISLNSKKVFLWSQIRTPESSNPVLLE